MLKLKYQDQTTFYEIEFCKLSEHIVQVSGSLPEKTCGFALYRMDGKTLLGDYSQYRTIYRKIDGAVQYSNDGSVYPIDTSLDRLKKDKIQLSKQELAKHLEEHPLESMAHGGIPGTYAVTEEKQSLMVGQYMTYQLEKAVRPDAKLTWNETGKECTEWTEQEFARLVLEVKAYVYPLVSHQQKLEVDIMQASTREELDRIKINYSEAGTYENSQ